MTLGPSVHVPAVRGGKLPAQRPVSSVFFVVEPSKITFLIENTIPQKEDRILLYIG